MAKKHNILLNRMQRHNQISTLFRAVDPDFPGENLVSPFSRYSSAANDNAGIVKAGLLPPTNNLPIGFIINAPLPSLPGQNINQNLAANEPLQPDEPSLVPPQLSQIQEPGEKSDVLSAGPQKTAAASTRASQTVQRQLDTHTPQSRTQTNPPAKPVFPTITPPAQPARLAQPASESQKEESKFTQNQLDRLQAIFDLHHNEPGRPTSTVQNTAGQVPNSDSPSPVVDAPRQQAPSKPSVIQRSSDSQPLMTVASETSNEPNSSPIHGNDSENIQRSVDHMPQTSSTVRPVLPLTKPKREESLAPLETTEPGDSGLQIQENNNSLSAGDSPNPQLSIPNFETGTLRESHGEIDQTPPLMVTPTRENNLNGQPAKSGQIIQRKTDPDQTQVTLRRPQAASPIERNGTPLGQNPLNEEIVQDQPLQDVWKVERRSLSTPQTSVPIQSTPTESPSIPPPVQKILAETAPGMPTDSRVETLTPRMPRPVAAPQSTRSLSLQRSAEESLEAPRQNLTELVESPVGPLPADLWRLIGEKPPKPQSGPGGVERVRQSEEDSDLPVHTQILSKSNSIQTQQTAGAVQRSEIPSSPSQTIQRAVVMDEISADVGDRSSRSSGQGDQQNELPADMDMDDLAGKVYAEIKRRLSTEWERLRNRF